MSGATSITSLEPEDVSRAHNIAAISQGQCTPMPLPSLGTRKIIRGNGTNVGTVISLQCPDRHRLVGDNVKCVVSTNTTQWVGETYCRPMFASGEFGFRMAMLASVVSSAVILLLTMAFVTCCLHERFKKKKKKKKRRTQNRDAEEEERFDQRAGGGAGYPRHHGRNNNNNNSSHPKAAAPQWGGRDGAFVDDRAPRGSCLHPCPDLTAPSSTPLPGKGYDRSPVTQDTRLDRDAAGPLQNSLYLQHASPAPHGPPGQMGCGAQESGPAQSLAACSADGRGAGVVRQQRMPLLTHHTSQESSMVNSNKECSIRIISV